MQHTQSIFKSTSSKSQARLWQKFAPGFSKQAKISLSFEGLKKSKKDPSQLTERYFYINGSYLCYRKKIKNSNFSGFLNLNWVTVKFVSIVDEKTEENYFGIKFIQDEKYSVIYVKTKEIFEKIKKEIARYCVFLEFYSEFKPLDFIARGSYGVVKNKKFLISFRFFELKKKDQKNYSQQRDF